MCPVAGVSGLKLINSHQREEKRLKVVHPLSLLLRSPLLCLTPPCPQPHKQVPSFSLISSALFYLASLLPVSPRITLVHSYTHIHTLWYVHEHTHIQHIQAGRITLEFYSHLNYPPTPPLLPQSLPSLLAWKVMSVSIATVHVCIRGEFPHRA